MLISWLLVAVACASGLLQVLLKGGRSTLVLLVCCRVCPPTARGSCTRQSDQAGPCPSTSLRFLRAAVLRGCCTRLLLVCCCCDLGIREQLNASLLRHVSALNGAVLAYDSLKLLDGLGCIRNDLPHIHLPVSLRILVFAPRVGDVLSGVVGRQGIDHTVLLVHGMFSATVVSTKKRAEGKLMRFVVRECNVADGRLSLVGEYSSSASRAGGAEHVLA